MLDKSLSGTMITRYYPHREFIDNLYTLYNKLYNQLLNNLNEVKLKFNYETCPENHLEDLYKINCIKRTSPYIASKINNTANSSYICYDPSIYCYLIDNNILSADNYIIKNNRIYLDNESDYIWASNTRFKKEYLYNSVGCIFNIYDKNIIIDLLFLIRYGFIKSVVEKFLVDYFGEYKYPTEYYVYNNKVYTHKYISTPTVWGKASKGVWGEPTYTYDEYDEHDVYIIEVPYKIPNGLEYFIKCIPYWLKCNLLLRKSSTEYFSNISDNSYTYHSKSSKDYYNKIKDGVVSYDRWGYDRWGSVVSYTPIYNNYVKVFNNESF